MSLAPYLQSQLIVRFELRPTPKTLKLHSAALILTPRLLGCLRPKGMAIVMGNSR